MDSTYVHLQQMLALDWSAPPPETHALLAAIEPRGRASGTVLAAAREDLAAEGRDERARGDRLLAGAAAIDVAVAAGRRPTWSELCAVQRVILGAGEASDPDHAPLVRSGPAGCRERRYGWWPGLPRRLAAKLQHDAAEPLHPVLHAVRLYLDLIHLHPFVDGNARAARLGSSWWLALAGLPLPRLDPLVRLPKPAGAAPWTFVHLTAAGVRRCLAPTGPCSRSSSP